MRMRIVKEEQIATTHTRGHTSTFRYLAGGASCRTCDADAETTVDDRCIRRTATAATASTPTDHPTIGG
jgi:hypothetical protein